MSIWNEYEVRAESRGRTIRETSLRREERMVNRKVRNNLSFQKVIIDGIDREVSIIDSEITNEKRIISLPREDFDHGGLVFWKDNYWLITEKDASNVVYTRGRLVQCNHLLKWVTSNGTIMEQWCVIDDKASYSSGELESPGYVVARGNTRTVMIIARNEETVNFNRKNRFLIDDVDAEQKLAYTLTHPSKMGFTYNKKGVFRFVLQESMTTADDNHELGIADYYKYYPKNPSSDNDDKQSSGKKVWL